MQLVQPIAEEEMVALFLRTEIQSTRWRDEILARLQRDGRDRCLVETPDLNDADANAYRSQLLGDFRGYRQQRELFENYPEAVEWYRATISPEELARVRYIDYSYWNELSGGSRLSSDAVQTIRAGGEVYGVSNTGFWKMARAVEGGVVFPELILVGTSVSSLIVLEGHCRLTAYLLVAERLPTQMPVLLGLSPDFSAWE